MNAIDRMPSVYPVTAHTDHVGVGSTFVAIQGMKEEGTRYITQAVAKGATRIVIADDAPIEQAVVDACVSAHVSIVRVSNCRKALAQLSAQAAGFPARQLKLFAVTGTKGKTTTASLLAHLLRTAGNRVALLSSVHNMIDDQIFKASLTTAQPDYLHQFFKLCVTQGITHCVMEVAAQATTLHRIETLEFDGIICTNFAREHLEFYDSLETYFEAKYALLAYAKKDAVLLCNGDDAWWAPVSMPATQFSMHNTQCAVYGTIDEQTIPLKGRIKFKHNEFVVTVPLSGSYNFYNCMGAVGMALQNGVSRELCQKGLASFAGVPGRFETYALRNGATCIIDLANNPRAFELVLQNVRPMTKHLMVVFGAGGERDAGRRPLMGFTAAQYADTIILTTDNPRSEDPRMIMQEISAGIPEALQKKVIVELDRERAIIHAYENAHQGSIILLLGKGNEDYQHMGNEKIPFSEREIVKQWQK